ncbi:Eco57I restriction-modification methylase domain-containing protein [Streptococcus danieliae]|uniref:Eco57I restriction-modification methylase domain-containing protein n=1 Tax=Streptococcus danieliae TaxID=747656 RepID=A0A7Z0LEK9_9STRE|nr:Eco57I restriction-modification methylase domain-containing protein [Streptococcus danieliae]MBF0717866.1 Eco57I restriction-modification methylase domain-containing protein [Streptococcus danieliae]NYS49796.1 Eco57I restriction-modification methylase domain-containing protein [Streptococcus danieliae]
MTQIDINEKVFVWELQRLLTVLLMDRTTKKSIVWATGSYEFLGRGFAAADGITSRKIINSYGNLIQPRSEKHKVEQKDRTKARAEVFTPAWLVKLQNDVIEAEISGLQLEDYVDIRWLELTCGEAPYMVSRYDAVTGEEIDLFNRVGFVDRKLQRISQEVSDEGTFFKLAVRAYQASYGYEYQGDNLLLARENLLITFEDYYQAAFGKGPTLEQRLEIATIISYNVMQMDGLTKTTPYSVIAAKAVQLDLFSEVEEEIPVMGPKKTRLKDWKKNKIVDFEDLSSEGFYMKFDVVIGNPPYQDNALGKNDAFAPPIYHKFMDSSYEIAEKAVLITPARFLFNAGSTPKAWNKKMLDDEHLKVTYFEQNSANVFPNTDIKGGVAVTYRDSYENFGAIEAFTAFESLKHILHKVTPMTKATLDSIISGRGVYKLSEKALLDYPEIENIQSKGHKFDVGSGAFKILTGILYFDERQSDEDVQILGLENSNRTYKWINQKYLKPPKSFYSYKIFIPKSNGSGAIGEVLSTPLIGEPLIGEPLIGEPLIGEPLIGATETFLSIGSFETLGEVKACLKYIKSKFARVLLGVLKITQDNTRDKWAKVPLQDFTVNSDIDWSQSVADIDRQLYKKYDLSTEEIAFIETKVREME